jgi:hypothetical protein
MYRGDQSDSLSNIMGMGYQPQAATSQMANTAVSSGMSAGAQIKATAMNNASAEARNWSSINSQQTMERNRLRQAGQQFSLTHQLGMDRLDMDRQGQLFGQQKDVATFFQNKANQDGMLGVAQKNADTSRITATDPASVRANNDFKEQQGASAEWDIYDTELDSIVKGLDPTKDAGKISAMADWRQKIAGWRAGPNSVGYLKAFRQSRMSNPLFGMVRGQNAAPADPYAGTP